MKKIAGDDGNFGYFFYKHNIDWVFEYVTPSVLGAIGYTPEEFMTKLDTFLIDSEINKKAVEHTELSIKGIQQPKYRLELRKKDGSICLAEVTELPVYNEYGKVIAVEGLVEVIRGKSLT